MDIDMAIANINADQDRANEEKRNTATEEVYSTEQGVDVTIVTEHMMEDDREWYDVTLTCAPPSGFTQSVPGRQMTAFFYRDHKETP